MTPVSTQRGQILILLAGFFFFGGAASTALLFLHGHTPAELKKAVKSVVGDETRRNAAQSEIDQWAKILKAQLKTLENDREDFADLAKRYDSTRPEADRIAAKVDDSIRDMDRSLLDTRFRLKEQLTQSEWEAMQARLKD